MKVIGVIPARYKSTRFEGKPLADICGKPMIWWVYNSAKSSKLLDEVFVATDDEKIENICKEYGMNVIMTQSAISTPTDRVYAVSQEIESDIYICINGDEPLISPESVDLIVERARDESEYEVIHAVAEIKNSAEVIDYSNLKVVAAANGDALYISRSPIPYPKGNLNFKYKKLVCIYAFTKNALDFYNDTTKGIVETTEDCDILRFLENRKRVIFVDVNEDSLSVDTPKDLEQVRIVMQARLKDQTL